jgi:hypothetical protein
VCVCVCVCESEREREREREREIYIYIYIHGLDLKITKIYIDHRKLFNIIIISSIVS